MFRGAGFFGLGAGQAIPTEDEDSKSQGSGDGSQSSQPEVLVWPKKSGWIKKAGVGLFGRDTMHWFVLNEKACTLAFYTDENQTEPAGEILMHQQVTDVHGDVDNQLDVVMPGQVAVLKFDNIDMQHEWWSALMETLRLSRHLDWDDYIQDHQEQSWKYCLCLLRPTTLAERSSSLTANRTERGFASERVIGKSKYGYDIIQDEDGNQHKESHYLHLIRQGYQNVVKAVIRPPRAQYTLKHLGPNKFEFAGRQIQRNDFTIYNSRWMKLHCSQWCPVPPESGSFFDFPTPPSMPCLVYLHGNASCRAESLSVLTFALNIGLSLVTLDTSGSGMSEGEFVSLGFYEVDDVKALCDHLRESGKASTIALWGRSMGAMTAASYASTRDPTLSAIICDSAFTSLRDLCHDLVKKTTTKIMSFAVDYAINRIKDSVKYRAGFNINDVSPISRINVCKTPAIFVHGKGDDFIFPKHSEALHEKCGGQKQLLIVEGSHNTPRPVSVYKAAQKLLTETMNLPTTTALPEDFIDKLSSMGSAINPLIIPPWTISLNMGNDGRVTTNVGDSEFVSGMSAKRQAEVEGLIGDMFQPGGGGARQRPSAQGGCTPHKMNSKRGGKPLQRGEFDDLTEVHDS